MYMMFMSSTHKCVFMYCTYVRICTSEMHSIVGVSVSESLGTCTYMYVHGVCDCVQGKIVRDGSTCPCRICYNIIWDEREQTPYLDEVYGSPLIMRASGTYS